jgi:hypothetical protein
MLWELPANKVEAEIYQLHGYANAVQIDQENSDATHLDLSSMSIERHAAVRWEGHSKIFKLDLGPPEPDGLRHALQMRYRPQSAIQFRIPAGAKAATLLQARAHPRHGQHNSEVS